MADQIDWEKLMPEWEFREVVDSLAEGRTVLLKAVADHFGVPMDLADARGKMLGLWGAM